MSCRHALLRSFAIGLTLFMNVGIVNAGSGGAYCIGQFATFSACNKAAASRSTIQGIPVGGEIDCTNTCETHLGFKQIPCGNDSHKLAAKICKGGTPTPSPFGGTNGNQCGYNWFYVTCP
jgi:hypothetical protein